MTRSMYEDSVELVWGVISDNLGNDLSADTVEMVALPSGMNANDDSAWQQPHTTDATTPDSVKRVALLITGVKIDGQPTRYGLWARLSDAPEVPILKLGSFTVR